MDQLDVHFQYEKSQRNKKAPCKVSLQVNSLRQEEQQKYLVKQAHNHISQKEAMNSDTCLTDINCVKVKSRSESHYLISQ